MTRRIIIPWSAEYEDYLRDESRCVGTAEFISFPESEEEVIEVLNEARAAGYTITVQGARTGITAGAVPQGGHVLNLSRMKQIGDIFEDSGSGRQHIRVQPGVLLSDLRNVLSPQGLFFPPDPTETSASIGGMVACNASGAISFHYGPTRKWVSGLRVVLSDGSILKLTRGEQRAKDRCFSVVCENGREIVGRLPSYTMPDVKSAAGYYVADDMDIIDLFIGSEGTLGIITEIELELIPKPKFISGLTVFLPSEESALKFVRVMRGEDIEGLGLTAARPVAIEFFNSDALNLLRRAKSNYSAFADIPALKPHYDTAVYVEFHGDSDDVLEDAVMSTMDAIIALGGSDDDTWYATTERELEPLKAFRHATPEAVNLLIGERKRSWPELTKLGTDMSVPDVHLDDAMAMYSAGLSDNGLESVVFGHIGNNHVHVNILPNCREEYDTGKSLYLKWAEQVVEWGGSVSAEHGIGKLKAPFLRLMYRDESIAQMRTVKALFDTNGILNCGNLF